MLVVPVTVADGRGLIAELRPPRTWPAVLFFANVAAAGIVAGLAGMGILRGDGLGVAGMLVAMTLITTACILAIALRGVHQIEIDVLLGTVSVLQIRGLDPPARWLGNLEDIASIVETAPGRFTLHWVEGGIEPIQMVANQATVDAVRRLIDR